jgi:mRNA-degrading endonuclease toxin of MazEF toxin-antitoxin module
VGNLNTGGALQPATNFRRGSVYAQVDPDRVLVRCTGCGQYTWTHVTTATASGQCAGCKGALPNVNTHIQQRSRPVIIVQDTSLSQVHGTVIVVPITSSPSQAQRPGAVPLRSANLRPGSVAIPWQIRAVDKRCFSASCFQGVLTESELNAVDRALRAYLSL